MATYRYVANDILKSLNQNDDDANIRISQVIYWIQVVANRIRVDQQQKTDSGLFVSTFNSVPVNLDNGNGEKYIDLPKSIMDLPNEDGVVFITYNESSLCCCSGPNVAYVWFQPTTLQKMHTLKADPYTKPSPRNPYFYRVGGSVDDVNVDRLYLLGIDCINVTDVSLGIRASLDPTDVCSLDDQVPIPDERIEELIKTVLDLGRWVSMVPEERINQGNKESGRPIPQSPQPPMPPQYENQENAE